MESNGLRFKWEGSRYEALRIEGSGRKLELVAQDLGTSTLAQFPITSVSRKSPFSPEVQRNEYYQVLLLTNKGILTLKSWSNPEVLRTFQLERKDKKEKQLIEDGLKREDQEVFCIVAQIMGKEVLGRVNCLPKHAPIIQLPDEMLEQIFSYLPLNERLQCREICSRFHEVLPLSKFVECGYVKFYVTECEGERLRVCGQIRQEDLNHDNVPEGVVVAALQRTPTVGIIDADPDTPAFAKLGTSPKLKKIVVKVHSGSLTCEKGMKMWDGVFNFVQQNKEHLETIVIYSGKLFGDYGDANGRTLDLQRFLEGCGLLKKFSLTLYQQVSVGNLNSLPNSIQELKLGRLSVPLLNTEVRWVLGTLKQLVRVELHVQHFHGTYNAKSQLPHTKGEDITETVISNALETLVHLKVLRMRLGFQGYWGVWKGKGYLGTHGYCKKTLGIVAAVERRMDRTAWSQSRDLMVMGGTDQDFSDSGEYLQFVRNCV